MEWNNTPEKCKEQARTFGMALGHKKFRTEGAKNERNYGWYLYCSNIPLAFDQRLSKITLGKPEWFKYFR